MPSEFETAMQGGIRELVDSALGQSVTVTQVEAEFAAQAIWREGENTEQLRPGIMATALVSLDDFTGTDGRTYPKNGDQITKDGTVYEVRGNPELNGVGGARLTLRFIRTL